MNERSSHWWLGLFAARLLQLNPDTSPPCAVRRAVACYHRARHLDPTEAADIVHGSAAGSESGGLRGITRDAKTQSARYKALFGTGTR